MSLLNFAKKLLTLPNTIKSNSLYFIKTIEDEVEFYITDDQAARAYSLTTKLVTTPKTLIENNRILLPSKPDGDLIFSMMYVYDDQDVAVIYSGVELLRTPWRTYAVLTEQEEINGYGVVSYMTRTTTTQRPPG